MRVLVFIFFLSCLSSFARAQSDSVVVSNPADTAAAHAVHKESKVLYNSDSLRFAKIELGRLKFTPFIGPSVSPETGLMLSMGGLLTFSLERKNPILQRSSLPISFGYSTTGAFQLSVKNTLFGPRDFFRITGELWLKDMPDNYWGVGYSNAINVPQSDTTTAYKRYWLRFYQKFVMQVAKGVFVGPIIDITNTKVSDINSRMASDPDYLAVGPKSRNTGIGLSVQYDSRDIPVNAYKGIFLEFAAIWYDKFLGGKSKFFTIDLDYRHYKQLSKRHILAWQVRNRNCIGNLVPWTDMALLGSPQDLRGYYWGRFRDKGYTYLLLEYRHMFNRAQPGKSGKTETRFGFATWYGNGLLHDFNSGRSEYIPCVGVGLRVEVQPRMNLRIDYGVGKQSNAFYLSFNEAF